MKQQTAPLKVFIHVPKTAGSTVNEYLERSGAQGASHVEAWIQDDAITSQKLTEMEWVSGHVTFPDMRARLSAHSFRHLRFFTLVREPVRQLMSHYNWLIEIYHRGGSFYDGHPQRIKEISESIRAADNDDPLSVIKQILAAPGLFLNSQSNLVLGGVPESFSDTEFRNRLSVYERIATEASLPVFLKEISGLDYEDARRSNVSPYHFDKRVFEEEILQTFITERHSADLALYDYLERQSRT